MCVQRIHARGLRRHQSGSARVDDRELLERARPEVARIVDILPPQFEELPVCQATGRAGRSGA